MRVKVVKSILGAMFAVSSVILAGTSSAGAEDAKGWALPKEIKISYWGFFLELIDIESLNPPKFKSLAKPTFHAFWFTEGDARRAGMALREQKLFAFQAAGAKVCVGKVGVPPCLGYKLTPSLVTIPISCTIPGINDGQESADAGDALISDNQLNPSSSTEGSTCSEGDMTFENAESDI